MIINGSYLIAYLSNKYEVIDLYGGLRKITKHKVNNNSVIYVDSEVLCNDNKLTLFFSLTESIKSALWIIDVEYMYNLLKDKGYNVIFEPYFVIIDHLLSFKLSNSLPIVPDYKDKIYFNLNRNHTIQREKTIEILEKNDLLKYGYVTANYLDEKFLNEFLIKENLDHYVIEDNKKGIGFERCQENELVSSNIKNFYHIAKKPGYISLIVESGHFKPQYKKFFPTEKTLIPFMTQRIPIILGNKGQVKDLEDTGIDVFGDLIDHSYDDLDYHDSNKPLLMIEKNLDILKTKIDITVYKERLQKNYDFIRTEWLDMKLDKFIKKIDNKLNM